jgi:hypothetical protein
MDDELNKLSEESNVDQPFLHPGHVQPKAESPTDTIFSRFIQKVGQIFNRSQPESKSLLGGRIKELQTMADGVIGELLEFKKRIKKSIDPSLYALVAANIDLLVKEARRVPHGIDKLDNKAKQVKVFSRYVDSIEKARLYVEIGREHRGAQQLEQALVQQTAAEFSLRIDRDIQVIQDYLSLALSSFEMSRMLENEIKDKLMPDLSPKILELRQLKIVPEDFSLDSFIKWRSHSDLIREGIFSTALHIIDEFSNEFLPMPKKEKENEHLQEYAEDLKILEHKVNRIFQEMKSGGPIDENRRKNYIAMIEKLEEEAHQLNTNLHLSYEHSERIENFLETLLKLRERL